MVLFFSLQYPLWSDSSMFLAMQLQYPPPCDSATVIVLLL